MKKIIYTRQDGGLSVVFAAPKAHIMKKLNLTEWDDADYEKHVWERSIRPDHINPRYIEDSEMPNDDYFRDAWIDGGNKIDIHLPKAKEVHMKNLRQQRDSKLKALDIEYQKALEAKDIVKQDAIAKQKQALRDMPVNNPMSDLTTPEAIKAFVPNELK